jgi:hypothetical protein
LGVIEAVVVVERAVAQVDVGGAGAGVSRLNNAAARQSEGSSHHGNETKLHDILLLFV